MLNANAKNIILSSLESSSFTASDFEVRFSPNVETFVLVTFRHDKNYSFAIKEKTPINLGAFFAGSQGGSRENLKFVSIERPGDFKATQEMAYSTYDACVGRIPVWCANLRAELQVAHIVAVSDEEFKHFSESLKFDESGADECFNDSELGEMNGKLDQLMERIRELEEDNKITKKQLRECLEKIDGLKSMAPAMKKGVWLSMLKSRLYSIGKAVISNDHAQRLMADVIRAVFLPK